MTAWGAAARPHPGRIAEMEGPDRRRCVGCRRIIRVILIAPTGERVYRDHDEPYDGGRCAKSLTPPPTRKGV